MPTNLADSFSAQAVIIQSNDRTHQQTRQISRTFMSVKKREKFTIGRLIGGSYRERPAILREEIQAAFVGFFTQIQAQTSPVLRPERNIPPSDQRFPRIPVHHRPKTPLCLD